MPLELVTVPCRTDNYAFLVHNVDTGETALIDAPEVPAIADALAARGWTLNTILITHHHGDHIEGVDTLRAEHGATVIGAAADTHRLPALDQAVADGDVIEVCGEPFTVMDASGHTVGHIAFYASESGLAFTADSLMALGCGRLFEGTPDQMWDTLSRFAALPAETVICSGHEYTAANARFALTVDPDNPALQARAREVDEARSAGRATVPSTLAEELATNPFLRAADPAIRAGLGLQEATDVEVFAAVRAAKDRF